jgi:hypothetical protein
MLLHELSDKALLSRTVGLCVQAKRNLARFIAHLLELEDRRLHERSAHPSLHAFCVHRLGLSEASAHRRIVATRLVRRFPFLLGCIERGEVHLSTLDVLRERLTDENASELVAATSGKTRRQVEELIAARWPKPDAPEEIERADEPTGKPRVQPLSEDRYRVQLTIGAETNEKLDRVRELMRHRNPRGDLEVIFDAAVTALLEKLEKEVLKKVETPHPRKPTKPGYVSDEVRRTVFARAGGQCEYVDADGVRCTERGWLEIQHVNPRGKGGSGELENAMGFCKTHNLHAGEEDFGEKVARHRKYATKSTDDARVLRGLVGMGHPERDARYALDEVYARHEGESPPFDDLVREASALLFSS